MKTILFGLALAAVGAGIVVWAVRRSIDFNEAKNPDPPARSTATTVTEADLRAMKVAVLRIEAEDDLTGRGEPWWPLWGTFKSTN